jgi:hypothetical protein
MNTNLAYLQFTLCDYISHIMLLDINMLDPLMEQLILISLVYSTLTAIKQVNASIIDVYARVCSCRQCWASKCRGL